MNLPYYITWTKQKDASYFDIESVSDVFITTTDQKKLIDMTSISYQAHFGYHPKPIINKIKKQLDDIPISSPKGLFKLKNETTTRLLDYMGKTDGKIFYTTGGAETIENALKIARDVTKKKLVLARKESYHGATLGALSVTGDWRNPHHQIPSDWVVRIPEPTGPDAINKTRKIIQDHGADNFAAIILETITGGNGVHIPSKEWWEGIQKICDEFNILLIMDEVVCGFERTGMPFGYNHYNVKPDLICLAKGITGGIIPFGAVWTSKKIADFYEENILCCGLTNYAHPLGIAALSGVLDIVSDHHFKENLKLNIAVFKEELESLSSYKIVKEIRSIGMIAAIELNETIEWKKFFNNGIYLVSQNKRIILAPPLIINQEVLKEAMSKIKNIFKEYV